MYGKISRRKKYTYESTGCIGVLCITLQLLFVSRIQSLWLLSHTGYVHAFLAWRENYYIGKGKDKKRVKGVKAIVLSSFNLRHCRPKKSGPRVFTSDLRVGRNAERLRTLNCWKAFSNIVVRLDFRGIRGCKREDASFTLCTRRIIVVVR